jgi:phosphopantothenoylcysteine decarboxylase
VKTPPLWQELTAAGHDVRVVATAAATYFFEPRSLPPGVLHLDADEWPRRSAGGTYQRDDPVLHVELRRWADLLLIAPLDANTLAKLACGLCDNCLTCVCRAWDPSRPVVLAPAMNTLMWEHPLTRRHLRQLLADHGGPAAPADADEEALVDWINHHCRHLRIVGPVSKRLACGDVGVGGLAELVAIVAAVDKFLSERAR